MNFECINCAVELQPWKMDGLYICPECRMGHRCPQPTQDQLAGIYSKSYYDSWGENDSTGLYWDLKRALFGRMLKLSGVREGNALDVGCATGACLSVFNDFGLAPYGVDVNAFAIKRAIGLVPNATLFEGSLENAGFAPDSFQIIIMSDVLEHSRNPAGLLLTANRLLAPGGQVIILTPDFCSVSARLMGSWWPHIKDEHLFYFSGKALRGLLEKHGFCGVKLNIAFKPLNLEYATRQFTAWPVPFVTPMVRLARRLAPGRVRLWKAFAPMGEMLVFASKP